MVTCRKLMELDIFHNIKLIAGREGLDRTVSWAYAKHTKDITPWVHGGELILVSGYENDMNESSLLQLIDEAKINDSSGILVEGGINFKDVPQSVIDKADEEKIPLFFIKGVISFLDINRAVSELITESEYIAKNISLIEQITNSSQNLKEVNYLLHSAKIPADSYFRVVEFTLWNKKKENNSFIAEETDLILHFSKKLQSYIGRLFEEEGLQEICQLNLTSVVYLLYGESEKALERITLSFKKVHERVNQEEQDIEIYLSLSNIVHDSLSIRAAIHECYFASDLMRRGIIPQRVCSFSETGSYQFLFYIEEKSKIIAYRDQYLKEMWEADQENSSQLLETLREYLKQDGNLLQTSKNLFVHRNTLLYRLQKIESMTGTDLRNYQCRRDFLNALMVLDVYPF